MKTPKILDLLAIIGCLHVEQNGGIGRMPRELPRKKCFPNLSRSKDQCAAIPTQPVFEITPH